MINKILSGDVKSVFQKRSIKPFSDFDLHERGHKKPFASAKITRIRKVELSNAGILIHPDDKTQKPSRANQINLAKLCGWNSWTSMREALIEGDNVVKGYIIEWSNLKHEPIPFDQLKQSSKAGA